MAEKKDVRVRDMDSRAWAEIKAYAARHEITVAAALTRAIWLLTGGFTAEDLGKEDKKGQ